MKSHKNFGISHQKAQYGSFYFCLLTVCLIKCENMLIISSHTLILFV